MDSVKIMAPTGFEATNVKRFNRGGKNYVAYESYPHGASRNISLCEVTKDGEEIWLGYKNSSKVLASDCYELTKRDLVNRRGIITYRHLDRQSWRPTETYAIELIDDENILRVADDYRNSLKHAHGLENFKGIRPWHSQKAGEKSLPAIFEYCAKFGQAGKEAFQAILKFAKI